VRAPRSLRRQLTLLFVMVGVLGTLLVAGLTAGFLRLSDTHRMTGEVLAPAQFAARDMFSKMLDEEIATRAYALAGDSTELEAVDARPAREWDETVTALDLLEDQPLLQRRHVRVTEVHERWRSGPAAVLRTAGEEGLEPSISALDASRDGFAAIRDAYEAFIADLRDLRFEANEDARQAERDLARLLVAGLIVLLVAAVLLRVGLRRQVLAPLEELGATTRRVRDGDLHREVAVPGPEELERLAADVEAMRARIVDDLGAMAEARADLERTNAELEQFAYVASHDLQEPLRKVASFCQLLQKRYGGQLDERADEYIAFAVDGAKRMQQLISDLLDFSRVGRLTSEAAPVDLTEAATVAVGDLEEVLREAGAVVEIGDLPTVLGDRSLLTALFQNLVANAAKFRHPDRPPRIVLGAERTGDEWHLWCADNGIGIEPRFAERVFLVFQRLHGRDAYEGTGIGLALCRKIVEHHGGRIWVDEAVDEGTVLHWTLPVRTGASAGEPGIEPGSGHEPTTDGALTPDDTTGRPQAAGMAHEES
jgi:signal transduction histidine kinase